MLGNRGISFHSWKQTVFLYRYYWKNKDRITQSAAKTIILRLIEMKTVFLVQHLHTLADGCEDLKIIGIYSTKEAAFSAIEKVKTQPGFSECPQLREPSVDENVVDGFYIDEYTLDEDHWTDGYLTV